MKSKDVIESNGIYTWDEVQELLHLKRWTLTPYIKKGELKTIKLSRKQIFLGEEILKFVKSKIK